jgi:hypothetical protein
MYGITPYPMILGAGSSMLFPSQKLITAVITAAATTSCLLLNLLETRIKYNKNDLIQMIKQLL